MSVRKRILAIKLYEKLQKYPEYAEKIGVRVEINHAQNKKKAHSNYGGNLHGS